MALTYVDLFAGLGGFSLGMEAAGFRSAGFVEWDDAAIAAHKRAIPGAEHIGSDIRQFNGSELAGKVDVVVGSPPCPTFSNSGRSALGAALDGDNRQHLWEEWVRLVKQIRPAMAILENAPGFMWHQRENLCQRITDALIDGYFTRYTIIDAARHGVAQHRERTFLVATRYDVMSPLDLWAPFPAATHKARIRPNQNRPSSHVLPISDAGYRIPPMAPDDAPSAVSLWEAIADLPHDAGDGGPMDDVYDESDPLYAHWSRRMSPRNIKLIKLMKQGDNYADMVRMAKRMNETSNEILYAIPPQNPDKFRTRWFRLREDEPSITITHHLGHCGLTHLHPRADRSITIREAARIQTFPDSVIFPGGIGESMFQIGNAVPPSVAFQFGQMCREVISGTWRSPHV